MQFEFKRNDIVRLKHTIIILPEDIANKVDIYDDLNTYKEHGTQFSINSEFVIVEPCVIQTEKVEKVYGYVIRPNNPAYIKTFFILASCLKK